MADGLIVAMIGVVCFVQCLNVILVERMQARVRGRRRTRSPVDDADWWKHEQPAQQPPVDDELDAEVDEVLDRINRVGIAGLTARERQVLKRASRQWSSD